ADFWTRNLALAALSLAPLFLILFTQRAVLRLEEAGEVIGRQNASLEEAHRAVIERSTAALEALSATVDARDTYTAGHSRRVASFAVELARELALDAMTTKRLYRDGMSWEDALAEIYRGRGTDFCEMCVDALERAVATRRIGRLTPVRDAAA